MEKYIVVWKFRGWIDKKHIIDNLKSFSKFKTLKEAQNYLNDCFYDDCDYGVYLKEKSNFYYINRYGKKILIK